MNLNINQIESLRVVDFVESSLYKVDATPDDEWTISYLSWKFPFLHYKKEKRGHYTVIEDGYKGQITIPLDLLHKYGYVIHDNKVCRPPRLEIKMMSGEVYTIWCKTIEDAHKEKEQILEQRPDLFVEL